MARTKKVIEAEDGGNKTPGTSLVDEKAIREQLAKKAADDIKSKISAPSGDRITVTQDKQFVMPNGEKGSGPLKVVILDYVSGNFYYDRPYKKGEETPAACFAIGPEPTMLKPSKNSPDKQSEDCASCPNNEFGSNGNGKACTNNRILAVVADSKDPNSQIMLLKVSPTALSAFDAYVKTIQTQFNSTPISVVTEIYFDPNLEYGSLRFGNPTPNKNLVTHFGRQQAALARLTTEPDVSQYKAKAPVKSRAKK